MLKSRMRVLIRAIEDGKNFSDKAVNNAVEGFLHDMTYFISGKLLETMDDKELRVNYLIWKGIALSSPTYDERIAKVLDALRIHLLPRNNPAEVTSEKVVQLFSKSIH